MGSGTTLIACERLGRVCYGMDDKPKSVDICLKRWEAETGQEAELVAWYEPMEDDDEDEDTTGFRAWWHELRHGA